MFASRYQGYGCLNVMNGSYVSDGNLLQRVYVLQRLPYGKYGTMDRMDWKMRMDFVYAAYIPEIEVI